MLTAAHRRTECAGARQGKKSSLTKMTEYDLTAMIDFPICIMTGVTRKAGYRYGFYFSEFLWLQGVQRQGIKRLSISIPILQIDPLNRQRVESYDWTIAYFTIRELDRQHVLRYLLYPMLRC
jgi:hypothetical protein